MKKKSKPKKVKKSLNVLITGLLRVHPRGFGFVQPDERGLFPEDIFIPRHLTKGAIDSDRVEVEVNLDHPTEKGPDGRVVKILQRGRSHIGGIVVSLSKNKTAHAYAPLLGSSQTIKIAPSAERTFTVGDRLVIHVSDWGSEKKEATGQMEAYLGHISDPACDVPAATYEYALSTQFSAHVIAEAKAFGTNVSKKELTHEREDLSALECFTIDPDTAKDFDDALSLSRGDNGEFYLGVHIADVSHYVRPGTALDEEAKARCNSTYFPGHVVPMLPHELSSHLCSLQPHVNRLAVTVFMTLDKTGTLLDYRITRSLIKSAHRYTYREAKEVLEGTTKGKHRETLLLMCELCHLLKRKRYERGSIEFSVPSLEIRVNKEGVPEKVEMVEYDITHQLVEEFMLKANEMVATHLAKKGKPLTYRVHDEPNPENMRDFALLARAFGFSLSTTPTSEELQILFDEARSSPFGQFLVTAFIRSMKLASYSLQNIGHYGLGLDYYTHFTSPIRRYIDLVVHRTLFDEMEGTQNLDQIALHCSEKERLSAKAEQAVITLKKLRLLQQREKKEPHKSYEAVIVQVKPFGILFEITELLLEGFLPLSQLEDDYYLYDEGARTLVGRRTRKKICCGEKIAVRLSELDLSLRETRWKLAGSQDSKKKRRQ